MKSLEICVSRVPSSNYGHKKAARFEHLADLFTDVYGKRFLHVGLYEGSHEIFRTVYAKFLRQRRSVMDETVRRCIKSSQNEHLPDKTGEQRARQNHCKI